MVRVLCGLIFVCTLASFVHTTSAQAQSKNCTPGGTCSTELEGDTTTTVSAGEDKGTATQDTQQTGSCTKELQAAGKCKPECPKVNYSSVTGGIVTCYSEVSDSCYMNDNAGTAECSSDEMQKIIDGKTPPQTTDYVGTPGSQSGSSSGVQSPEIEAQKALRDAEYKLAQAQKNYDQCWWGCADEKAALEQAQQTRDAVQDSADYLNEIANKPPGTYIPETPLNTALQNSWANNVLQQPAPAVTESRLGDFGSGLREALSPDSFSNSAFRDQWNGWNPNVTPSDGAFNRFDFGNNSGFNSFGQSVGSDISGGLSAGPSSFTPFSFDSGLTGSPYDGSAPFEPFDYETSPIGPGWGNDDLGKLSNFDFSNAPLQPSTLQDLSNLNNGLLPTLPSVSDPLGALKSLDSEQLPTVSDAQSPNDFLGLKAIAEQQPPEGSGLSAEDFSERLEVFKKGFGNVVDSLTEGVQGIFAGDISAPDFWDKTLKNIGVGVNAGLGEGGVRLGGILDYSPLSDGGLLPGLRQTVKDVFGWGSDVATPPEIPSGIQGGGALTAGESYRRELDAAKQASAAAGERARRADENARSTGSYDPDNAFEVERYNAAQAEIKAAREEQAAAQARLAAAQADVDRIRARDNQVPGQGSIANTGVNEAKVVADSGVRDTQGTESLAYQRAAKDYQALLPLAAPVTNALQDANSAWIKRAEEIGLIENIGTADKPQYRIRPELTETQRINKMGMLRDETDRLNLAKDQYKTYAETLKDARDKTLYAAGADPLFSDAARANALLGDMRLRPEQEIPIDEYWQDKNGLAMGVGAAGAMGRYVLRMDPYQPVINSNAQEIAFNELQAKQEALIQSLAGCTDCQNVIEAIERNNELAKQFESGQFEGAQKDYLIKLSDQNPIQRDLPVGDLTTQELASRASNEWGRLLRGTQEYLGAEMGKAWEEGEYGKATALFLLQTPGQITQGLLGAESLQGLGQTLYGADTSILGLTIPGGEAGYNIVRNVTDAGTLSVVTGAYLFPGPAGLALRGADSLAASAGRFAGNIADVRSALNVADSGAGFGYDFSGRPSADAIIRDGGLAVVPENNISTAPARDGGSSPPPQLTSNAPSPTSRSVTQPPPLRNEFSPTGGARTSGNAVQGAPPSASFIPGTSPLGDLADAMRRGSPTLITPSNFGRTGDDVLFGGAANDNLMGSTPAGGPPLENRWFAFARAPEDGGGAGRGGTIIPFTPRASELPSVGGGDTIVFREGFGSDAPPARVDAGAIDDATLRELENILANEPDQFVFRTVDDAVTPDGVTDLLQRRYGGASLEEIAKAREAIRLNEAARRLDSQNTSQATADASTLRARAAQIATDINDPALGRLAESWGGERAPSAAGAGVPDSVVAAEAAQPKPASGILSPITNTPFARALCVIGGLFCGSQAVPGQLVNDLNPLGISSANAKPAALPVQLVHDGVLGVETGAASTYNPNVVGWRTGGEKLATGGRYNPDEFEAALQTGLAEQYRMGHSRYPNVGYALVEAEGRKLIVRINDNGPLVRNRIIDLNEASMRYLSGGRYGNNSGVLQNTRVTVLAGQNYTPGPLANDATLLARAEIPPASPTAPRIETGSLSAPKSAVDSAVDEITKRAEQVGDAVRKAGDDLAKALDIRPGTPETDFMKNVQGKLVETPPPAALIKNFDVNNHTSAEARAVQEALRAQGYDTAVDGVIGPQTIRALESARVDIDGALRNIFTDQADYQQARRIFLERFKGMPKNFEQPLLTMLRKMQEAGQALPGDNQPIVLVNVSGSREGVAIMSLTHNDGLLLWEGSPTLRVGVAANGPIDWAKDFIGSNKTIVGSVAKIIGGEHRGDKAWAVGALYRESIDGGLQNERVTWYHGVSNRAVTPGQRPNATSGCVSMCSLVMQNLYDQVLGTPGVGEPGWQLAGRDGAVRGANKINGGYTYEFSEQVTNSVGVAENKAIAQKEPVMVADAAPGGGATQGLTPETAEIARVYEISGETGTIPKGAILEVSPDGKTLTYGETVYQAKQISGEPIPLEPASALSIIDLKPLQVDWLDRIQIEGVPKLGLELQVWRPDFNAAVENVMRGVNDGISEFKQIVSGVPGDISKWVSRNSFNVSVSLEPNPAWLKAVGDSANTAAERITIMYRDAYAALDDFPSAPPTPGDPLFGLFALGSTRRTSNAPSQTPIPEGVDTPPAGLGLQAPPSKIAGTGDTQKFVPTSRNINPAPVRAIDDIPAPTDGVTPPLSRTQPDVTEGMSKSGRTGGASITDDTATNGTVPAKQDTPPAGLGLQAPPSKIAGTGDTQKFVPTSRNINPAPVRAIDDIPAPTDGVTPPLSRTQPVGDSAANMTELMSRSAQQSAPATAASVGAMKKVSNTIRACVNGGWTTAKCAGVAIVATWAGTCALTGYDGVPCNWQGTRTGTCISDGGRKCVTGASPGADATKDGTEKTPPADTDKDRTGAGAPPPDDTGAGRRPPPSAQTPPNSGTAAPTRTTQGGSGGSGLGGLMGMLGQFMQMLTGQGAQEPDASPTGSPKAPTTVTLSCDPSIILNRGTTTIRWACSGNERSTGVNFDTRGAPSGSVERGIDTIEQSMQFGVSCGGSAPRSCSVRVLHPRITLTASPGEVESGTHARLNWAGVGVRSCGVLAPTSNEIARGTATGFVDTPDLTRSQRFAVVCSTDAGKPVHEFITVRVAGDDTDPEVVEIPEAYMRTTPSSAASALPTAVSDLPSEEGSSFFDGSANTPSPSAPQEPITPPPGTFTATDAQGNAVFLCDPEAGIDTYISCISGGRW